MKWRVVVWTCVGALWASGAAQGTAIRPGFDSSSLPPSDALWSPPTPMGFDLDFLGVLYSSVYVNTNGNVTFGALNLANDPYALGTKNGLPIIAPFFADVDTRGAGSSVIHYGAGTADGHKAFGVNWIDVGYFWKHSDKLNRFQLVLIDRSDRAPGDVDIEFNYEKIVWESGDWSGGSLGLGGSSARVGFADGTGNSRTFYEFPGSGQAGYFLDSRSTGLVHHRLNSPILGRYVFTLDPDPAPIVPVPGALLLAAIGTVFVARWRGTASRMGPENGY